MTPARGPAPRHTSLAGRVSACALDASPGHEQHLALPGAACWACCAARQGPGWLATRPRHAAPDGTPTKAQETICTHDKGHVKLSHFTRRKHSPLPDSLIMVLIYKTMRKLCVLDQALDDLQHINSLLCVCMAGLLHSQHACRRHVFAHVCCFAACKVLQCRHNLYMASVICTDRQ